MDGTASASFGLNARLGVQAARNLRSPFSASSAAPNTYEMDEIVDIVDIVRRIGRQQGQNAYYRTCYTLLKKSQDLILRTSNELLDLYHSNAFEEPGSVSTIAEDLRNDIQALIARERRARSYWDEFFGSDK